MQSKWQYLNLFFLNFDHEDPFHMQWYGRKNEINCGRVETSASDV